MTERDKLLPRPFCGSGLARPMTNGLSGFSGVEVMDPSAWNLRALAQIKGE